MCYEGYRSKICGIFCMDGWSTALLSLCILEVLGQHICKSIYVPALQAVLVSGTNLKCSCSCNMILSCVAQVRMLTWQFADLSSDLLQTHPAHLLVCILTVNVVVNCRSGSMQQIKPSRWQGYNRMALMISKIATGQQTLPLQRLRLTTICSSEQVHVNVLQGACSGQ